MFDIYTKESGLKDSWDLDVDDDFASDVRDESFHIKQSYAENSLPKKVCKQCGGDKFIVGSEEQFTAIKCPICEWEMCIHQG